MTEHQDMAAHAEGGRAAADAESGWHALHANARVVFMVSGGLGLGLPTLAGLAVLAVALAGRPALVAAALAGWLLLVAWAVWLGAMRYRYTRWRLDDDGFALRRGRLWHSETRVPRSRVQHIDLKRGPLERRFGLATLVIHTAGTRHSAVTVPGLDAEHAERLRDQLARGVEHDDDES